MVRKSCDIQGMVNFPISDKKYKNTNEGGMFVRLVVVDTTDQGQRVCCGGDNHILYDEELVGDDALIAHPEIAQEGEYDHENFHFPFLGGQNAEDYISIKYEAILTIGSTGWSGWGEQGYWTCSYNNLTDDGKALYDLLVRTYPNCELFLQTWLDT